MSYLGHQLYSIQLPGRVLAGPGSIESLRELLGGAGHVLLLADQILLKLGLLNTAMDLLKEERILYTIVTDIPSEPLAGQVQEILEICRLKKCDCVVAIGGGSVLDSAKIVSLLIGSEKSVYDLLADPLAEKKRNKGLILIPTTAGTGSEATPNAIVTEEDRELKIGIVNPAFIPDVVILDPTFTLSLPASVTAATGMDALAHALESYISKKSNPICHTYAIEAMRLIFRYLPVAYAQPQNMEARHAMLYASFLGGLCIACSSTTAVHALAYPLGGKYHIPHGVSNAMLLPHVMDFNRDVIGEELKKVAVNCLGSDTENPQKASQEVIDRLYALSAGMKIPQDLKQYGVKAADLEQLAKDAFTVRRLLDNNPKDMTVAQIRAIYEKLI